MNCPHCNIPLMMTERKGIEIDFCSQCRGVWLDKGELDKIIDLSVQERSTRTAPQHDPRESYHREDRDRQYQSRGGDKFGKERYGHKDGYHRGDQYHKKPYYKYKKKKTLMGELFDIFD